MRRPVVLYSIGHSNHAIEEFVGLLAQHGVTCLVDVRSAPYSRYSPHFSRRSLEAHLSDGGISYVFLGKPLGGRPEDESCYDTGGQVDYGRISQKPWYLEGVHQLVQLAAGEATAMMCSEEDPARCHRNLLIADTLLRNSMAVVHHIRGDGALEEATLAPKQTRLF